MLKNAIQSAGCVVIHVKAGSTHNVFLKRWFGPRVVFKWSLDYGCFSSYLPSLEYII